MPELEEIQLPSNQVDASTELRDDVSRMVQKLAHHEAAFSRFAARQELLLTKIIEALDKHSPAHEGIVAAASCSSQTPTDTPRRSYSQMKILGRQQSWETKGRSSTAGFNAKESGATGSWFRRCVASPQFEISMGLVVIFHMLVMCSHLQWKANVIRKRFHRPETQEDPIVHVVMDKVFNGAYLTELCARLFVHGTGHFRQSPIINTADTLVIVLCCLVSFVLDPLNFNFGGEMIALARVIRIGRICRVLRAFKIFRFLNLFTELRIIIESLQHAFSRTLLWASIVIGFTIFVASLLITTLCLPYIEDADMSVSKRRWLHEYCGTPAISIYTMFEATFTGRWGIPAKTLIMDINPFFSFFFACYVLGISFATMKVIGAIFLKQTLDQAHLDNEKKSFQKMKEKERRSNELREMFKLGDADGDGKLDTQELADMMENLRTLEILEGLEIDPDEMWALISMLSDDQGYVDFDGFLDSALKLNSSAQVVDVIQILHSQQIGMKRLDEIMELLQAGRGATTQVVFQAPSSSLKQKLANVKSPRTPRQEKYSN